MTTGRINQVAAFRDPGPDSLLLTEDSSRPEAAQPRTLRCGDLASCFDSPAGFLGTPRASQPAAFRSPTETFPPVRAHDPEPVSRCFFDTKRSERFGDGLPWPGPCRRPAPGGPTGVDQHHEAARLDSSSNVFPSASDASSLIRRRPRPWRLLRAGPDLGPARHRFPSRGACAGRWLQLPSAPHRSRLSLTMHSWASALPTAVRHVGPDSRDQALPPLWHGVFFPARGVFFFAFLLGSLLATPLHAYA